jgi:hypothetical protein
MSIAATNPASVAGAVRPDPNSRIVALAASMGSLCVIVPVLIFSARIIKSSPALNDLFFPRLPILAILCFATVGVAGYGVLKGFTEKWLRELIETCGEQLAAWGEKERSAALYATITILSGLTLFLELVLIRWQGSLFPVFLQELHAARLLLRPRHRLCAGAQESAAASCHSPHAGADHISADVASLRDHGGHLLLRAGEGRNIRLRSA